MNIEENYRCMRHFIQKEIASSKEAIAIIKSKIEVEQDIDKKAEHLMRLSYMHGRYHILMLLESMLLHEE